MWVYTCVQACSRECAHISVGTAAHLVVWGKVCHWLQTTWVGEINWPMNPRALQVSASPALALWVTATLSAFEFLKHGHWLSNSVLPTHGAGTLLRGHCPMVTSIRICFSSSSLAQRRQRLLCFYFTGGENERLRGQSASQTYIRTKKDYGIVMRTAA